MGQSLSNSHMASSSAEKKVITLRSSDGELFELDESAAAMSQTIKYVIEDGCADTAIPLANVDGKILAKVVHYCTKHVEMERTLLADLDGKLVAPNVKRWDAEFMKEVDMNTLYELLLAADYLDNKSLLDLVVKTTAEKIAGKTPEEIRELFGIKNDFTPEEEEAIRKENRWAFE